MERFIGRASVLDMLSLLPDKTLKVCNWTCRLRRALRGPLFKLRHVLVVERYNVLCHYACHQLFQPCLLSLLMSSRIVAISDLQLSFNSAVRALNSSLVGRCFIYACHSCPAVSSVPTKLASPTNESEEELQGASAGDCCLIDGVEQDAAAEGSD